MKLIKNNWEILLIVLISFVPLIPLFGFGLPDTHDGRDHVARIANFYNALSEGVIIPRWAGNLNWGYGHPILMFLYPLSSYLASAFHFIGFSLVDSLKIVFGVGFILSGVFMYMWLRTFLGSSAALTGAILYNFAPYRFVDLYVRGAIGEHMAFIFPPIILYFISKLHKEKLNYFYAVGIAVSTACLLLAHNAISLMFFPFIMIYSAFLYLTNKDLKKITLTAVSIFYGFLLSAFFWIPGFLEGKYTLRDIVTEGVTTSRFVDFPDLIYGSWNYGGTGDFSVQLGLIQWIIVLVSPFILFKIFQKKKSFNIYHFTFIYFVLSILIMLPFSKPVWEMITTLQKFQFPWRFLTVSVFTAALLGAFVVSSFNNNTQKVLIVCIAFFALILNYNYWQPKGYLVKEERFYTDIYNGTTDTGESAPIWSVRFMESRPKASIEVIDGNAKIVEKARTSVKHSYVIDALEESRIRENTLYFPGWKVYVDGVENKQIEFQDSQNRGLMTYYVSPGKHNVDVLFEDTKVRMISNIISIVSIFGLILFSISILFKKK